MIAGIAALIFIPLLAVFFVRIIWAFGANWPAKDAVSLAQTVSLYPAMGRLPSRLLALVTGTVALGIGIFALTLSDPALDHSASASGLVMTLIFAARGIVGFTPPWRQTFTHEPFATLDRKFYSPLYLFLALGFGVLTLWRLI